MYNSHPSILRLKKLVTTEKSFDLPEANVEEINKIIRSLNTDKATEIDGISAKIVKIYANVIDNHLCTEKVAQRYSIKKGVLKNFA